MITSNSNTYITPSIEDFIFALLSGIEAANDLNASYRVELSANDVAVLAIEYKKISNIKIS